MKEGEWTARLVRALREAGATVFKIPGTMMQSGLPDMFFAWEIRYGWIEVKSESGALRPMQKQTLVSLEYNSFPAYVLRFDDSRMQLEDHTGQVISTVPYSFRTIAEDFKKLWD